MFGETMMRWLERRIILDIVDTQWKDHLLTLDHLKEGIGLRGYGQKDPLVEFKKEAFILFEDMMGRIDTETVRYLFLVQPAKPEDKRAKLSGGSAGSNRNSNTRQAPRKPKSPSQSALVRKSAGMNLVRAGAERNTRSATEQPLKCHSVPFCCLDRKSFHFPTKK